MLELFLDMFNIPLQDAPLWLKHVIYIVTVAALCLLATFIVRLLLNQAMKKSKNKRAETVFSMLKKVATVAIFIFAVLEILQEVFGVSPAALIAAAGILSVALGFGAQSLVKDIISGFFILLDDQYSVGETITIDGFKGEVLVLGLRTTRLKGEDGELIIIPNGAISKVINHSRNNT